MSIGRVSMNAEVIAAMNDRDISEAADTCCVDVWENWKDSHLLKPQARACTDSEMSKISMRKVIFKQFVSITLLAAVIWFIEVELSNTQKFGDIFNCDPDSSRSLQIADGVSTEFHDDGVSYCFFKSALIIISFIFLIPFFLEKLSSLTIIWISSINDEVLIPVADGLYAGYDFIYDGVLEANPFKRAYALLAVFVQVPKFVRDVAKTSDNYNATVVTMLWAELAWKFLFFMLPDLLLTASLFPVSYYVMQASDSADGIIVNLVAVQFFAQLDGIFVKMLLRPRASIGESIQNYLSHNPKSEIGKYSPLEAYKLTVNRHEWGVKVKGMNQMKELHDYSGFHFAP